MRLPFFDRHPMKFGSCCKDLQRSMTVPQNSHFRVSEEGVLYLTVGYVKWKDGWKEGVGWFDQAAIFCPFCGKRLQSKEEIRIKLLETRGAPQ
jgi:hypothetical protein